jgi:CheY-like chemotaxis protein
MVSNFIKLPVTVKEPMKYFYLLLIILLPFSSYPQGKTNDHEKLISVVEYQGKYYHLDPETRLYFKEGDENKEKAYLVDAYTGVVTELPDYQPIQVIDDPQNYYDQKIFSASKAKMDPFVEERDEDEVQLADEFDLKIKRGALKGKKILVVDDEPDYVKVIAKDLVRSRSGAKVKTATSVEEAKQLIEDEKFDLIYTDLCMGNDQGAGFELVDFIRSIDKNVPVISASVAHYPNPNFLWNKGFSGYMPSINKMNVAYGAVIFLNAKNRYYVEPPKLNGPIILPVITTIINNDPGSFMETPTTLEEYKLLVTKLTKQQVGYFNIQTMRERVLREHWSDEAYREQVLKDYLSAIKREHKRGYIFADNIKAADFASADDLLSRVEAYEKRAVVSGKELPVVTSDVEYSIVEHFLTHSVAQITGKMNGGRERVLSEIQFRIINKRKLRIMYMSTHPRIRGKGYSLELFKNLLAKYPEINEISGELAETNSDVVLSTLVETMEKNNIEDALTELKSKASLYAEELGKKAESSIGIMNAQTGKEMPLKVYSVSVDNKDDFSKLITDAIVATPLNKINSNLGFELKEAMVDVKGVKVVRNAVWVKPKDKSNADEQSTAINEKLDELEEKTAAISSEKDLIQAQFMRQDILDQNKGDLNDEQMKRLDAAGNRQAVQGFRVWDISNADLQSKIQLFLSWKSSSSVEEADKLVDAALDILLDESTDIGPKEMLIIIETSSYIRSTEYQGKYKDAGLIVLLDKIAKFLDVVNKGKLEYERTDFEKVRTEARELKDLIKK